MKSIIEPVVNREVSQRDRKAAEAARISAEKDQTVDQRQRARGARGLFSSAGLRGFPEGQDTLGG
jgi:hypothetical protein